MLFEHFDAIVDTFITEYQLSGGPKLDRNTLVTQYYLALCLMAMNALGTIPGLYQHIPRKDWATVKVNSARCFTLSTCVSC